MADDQSIPGQFPNETPGHRRSAKAPSIASRHRRYNRPEVEQAVFGWLRQTVALEHAHHKAEAACS